MRSKFAVRVSQSAQYTGKSGSRNLSLSVLDTKSLALRGAKQSYHIYISLESIVLKDA
jgi:hypothetical protein